MAQNEQCQPVTIGSIEHDPGICAILRHAGSENPNTFHSLGHDIARSFVVRQMNRRQNSSKLFRLVKDMAWAGANSAPPVEIQVLVVGHVPQVLILRFKTAFRPDLSTRMFELRRSASAFGIRNRPWSPGQKQRTV